MKKIILFNIMLISSLSYGSTVFNSTLLNFHENLIKKYSSLVIIENNNDKCGIERMWSEPCYDVFITYKYNEDTGNCSSIETRTPNGKCSDSGVSTPPPLITNCDWSATGGGPVTCTTNGRTNDGLPTNPNECSWDSDLQMQICP